MFFLFFPALFLFYYGSLSDSFLSLFSPHLVGLLVHVFYHHPDFLCYLSYILMVLLILSHGLLCLVLMLLHYCYHLPLSSVLPFGSSFCSEKHFSFLLFSSLILLPLFFILCDRFLSSCCVTVIIAIFSFCLSVLPLFSLVFLPTINYTATITGRRFRYQSHCCMLTALYKSLCMLLFLRLEYTPMGRGCFTTRY